MKQAQQDALAKFRAANIKTIRKKAVDDVTIIMLAALRKQGWGKKRLKQYWDEVCELSQDISAGYLTFDDIYQALEEEVGIVFE